MSGLFCDKYLRETSFIPKDKWFSWVPGVRRLNSRSAGSVVSTAGACGRVAHLMVARSEENLKGGQG